MDALSFLGQILAASKSAPEKGFFGVMARQPAVHEFFSLWQAGADEPTADLHTFMLQRVWRGR